MADGLILVGGLALFLCVVGLLMMSVMFFREHRPGLGLAALVCMGVLVFLGIMADQVASGWWR